jgi:hypothetical protein
MQFVTVTLWLLRLSGSALSLNRDWRLSLPLARHYASDRRRVYVDELITRPAELDKLGALDNH